MAGRALVVVKEVFHHKIDNTSTLWEWLNDEKQFFLFKFKFNFILQITMDVITYPYWDSS